MILGTDSEAVTVEQSRQVAKAVELHMANGNLNKAYVARQIGVSTTTIWEVLAGKYKGDWQGITLQLDRWLEDEQKREQAPRPTEFVRTQVAEDIFTVASVATQLKTIGLVYGPPGIGKTLALQAVAAEKPGSLMISITSTAASASGLLTTLSRMLKVLNNTGFAASQVMFEGCKQRLANTSRLLIIDEVHKLCGAGKGDEKSLNVIRDLHDHTGIPILLCGTTDLVDYLDRKQVAGGKEPLGQIRRRIGICSDLTERTRNGDGGPGGEPLFTVEEVRKVFGKSKIRLAPDAARYLMLLANLPDAGALGACRNVVVMATKLNESKGEPALTADMLRTAQRLLVNRRAYTLLETQMQEVQGQRPLGKVG
jgi:DNA transposition AAA+ family ATPase